MIFLKAKKIRVYICPTFVGTYGSLNMCPSFTRTRKVWQMP